MLLLHPDMRPRENIKLKSQRQIFALRTKIKQIKANFCSSKHIEKWTTVIFLNAQEKT